jgi:electron-transferring-flavoprotein dehydrogenase
MNVLKIKGSHTAIKSGYEAANAIFDTITDPGHAEQPPKTISLYQQNMEKSWVWNELHAARNIKNSFKNLYTGLIYGGIYKFLQGREPFDLRGKVKDSARTEKARYHKVSSVICSPSSTPNTTGS